MMIIKSSAKMIYAVLAILAVMLAGSAVADGLNLVPWPQSVERGEGYLVLGDKTRIVAGSGPLAPLAEVLSGEIEALFSRRLAVAEYIHPRDGGIVLRVDPQLGKEEYRLQSDDAVWISGGSYAAVAAGTTTLLQAITVEGDELGVPVLDILDRPQASYRGLLLDPARKFHPPAMLRQAIDMCRWYKIRYLQLHLTDDQSFTFPSQAYPRLATPGRHYTLEQLHDLERYAAERGVVIVPEFDVPGHSGAAVKAMPELFATKNDSHATLNFASQETCEAVDTIIREMAAVFRTTPYFHIGSDEVNKTNLDQDPEFQAAIKKTGVSSVMELYRKFIVDRNETVRQLGKQTIVWEGFRPGGETDIPRNILVMAFEGGVYYRPDHLVENGYTIINTSWQPLYVVIHRKAPVGQWPIEHIYDWNMYRFEHFIEWAPAYNPIQLPTDAPVLGAQICSWENKPENVLPYVRQRLAAMSERIWNPDADCDFEDFSRRLKGADARLEALLGKQ